MWKKEIQDMLLYEDGQILVCRKPSGLAVQNSRIGVMDMESVLKNYLAEQKPGEVPYLGIISRLDQPVEGVLVFAKTPQAASRLNAQMEKREMKKFYLAVTDRAPGEREGWLEDYLLKDGKRNVSAVVKAGTRGAKKARLFYRVLQTVEDKNRVTGMRCLLEIRLETGRHHQIRLQMSHMGCPLVGDRKYYPEDSSELPLGLCSCAVGFRHPQTGKNMKFQIWPQGAAFAGFDSERTFF
ncbi:MAG TPA: RNA pseudouridine synthase [Candidatus Blautia faecipullorum]|nr:RNA pseudouridine synthase [Candidatus Blautia faecipullorum]